MMTFFTDRCGFTAANASLAVGAVFVSREVSLEIVPIAIFFITMLLSIKFKVNPVIITFLMMIIGAIACV